MVAKNKLLEAPPYAVEQAVKRLAADLRTARIRRNYTIESVARRIGTGSRAVRDAESGKTSSSIGVYAALLWAYDLLTPFQDLANPTKDQQGMAYAAAKANTRSRQSGGLDNDF